MTRDGVVGGCMVASVREEGVRLKARESFRNIPVVLIQTFRAKCRNDGTAVDISSLQHTPLTPPPFHLLGSLLSIFHVVVISEYFLLPSSNLDQANIASSMCYILLLRLLLI